MVSKCFKDGLELTRCTNESSPKSFSSTHAKGDDDF